MAVTIQPTHEIGDADLSYDELPIYGAALRRLGPATDLSATAMANGAQTDDDDASRQYGRRRFLNRLMVGAALTIGLATVDLFGGRTKAARAAKQCPVSGLMYRTDRCVPSSYSTSCSKGCYRSASVSNSSYCKYSDFNSRHRTCGEDQHLAFLHLRQHEIRTNACGGEYDGWQWYGVDSGSSCGCSGDPKFSCNDGYARYVLDGEAQSWYKSICEQFGCR